MKNLIISQIIQKCKIVVDEQGTAAAVTVVTMRALPMVKEREIFIGNRPFTYYIIYEKTKSIIFNGLFYGKSNE